MSRAECSLRPLGCRGLSGFRSTPLVPVHVTLHGRRVSAGVIGLRRVILGQGESESRDLCPHQGGTSDTEKGTVKLGTGTDVSLAQGRRGLLGAATACEGGLGLTVAQSPAEEPAC